MTLAVIGAGFGRTGTLSLKLALETLGFGPCYHMRETRTHPEHDPMWLALARGETPDWRPILDAYRATVDWPAAFFWKRLADNSDAKIILTVRDPDAWYASCAATIFARMKEAAERPSSDPMRRRHMQMVNAIVAEKTFGGSLAKANALRVFNRHNDEVRALVPRERLLVLDCGEGWERLCAFLGVAAPSSPYPRANVREDFAACFPLPR